MSRPRLLADLLSCVDQSALRETISEHVTRLIDETLDEWDDSARWRELVTRFGREAIHDVATIAVTRTIDDVFVELRG